jgi:hypothetical protein
MGPMALLPSEGNLATDFIALKNTSSSAGSDPENPLHPMANTIPLDHRERPSNIVQMIVKEKRKLVYENE